MTTRRRTLLATIGLIASLLVSSAPAGAATGGTISGSITDFDTASPFPIPYAHFVDLFDTTTLTRYREIVSDPSLPYTFSGIPAGTYRMRVRTFGTGSPDIMEGYQWWTGGPPGATTYEGATDLIVTDGGFISADFAIDEIVGAGIDGTITNSATSLPIEDCHVVMAWEATSGIGIGILAGPTDPTGTYAFGNLPGGDYVVSVWENYGSTAPCDHVSPNFYDEWFGGGLTTDLFAGQGNVKLDNPPLIGTATPVTIGGSDVTVDFALTPIPGIGGTVTGSITDFDTASPFPMPYAHFVDLFDTTTLTRYREIVSDPSLPYTFSDIPAGTYRLRVRTFGTGSPDIMEGYQWWTGAPPGATVYEGGTDVIVADGGLVVADFAIDEIVGAGIDGTITDAVTTLPIEDCHVVMAWEATSGIGIGILAGPTDPTGTYAFGNLPGGDYVVSVWENYGVASPCDGSTPDYFDEWFGGGLTTDLFAGQGNVKLDNPPLIGTATPVTIGGSDVTVDFALTPFCSADFDGDSIPDCIDPDDDNDGVPDGSDAFPFDPTETTDTDGDGIGDNADTDDDNDGQSDADELACGSNPLDAASLSADFDSDGIPDCVDPDDDNDGIPDGSDAVPQSDTSAMVEIDGAATGVANQTLPDGSTMADRIAEAAADAKNHGNFTRAVSKLTNAWKKAGLITGKEKGAIQSAAAGASLP